MVVQEWWGSSIGGGVESGGVKGMVMAQGWWEV